MFAGIDFGTSNSAVSLTGAEGDAHVVPMRFPSLPKDSDTLRSMLAFEKGKRDSNHRLSAFIGQEAVETYLRDDGECRLLQSFKSYLTSRAFSSASIFGASYSLEDMIALVVSHLRTNAEAVSGSPMLRVVAGRPVRFVAEDGRIEDDYALERLRQAFGKAGLEEVHFEYEPIAAACYYERQLDHDETVLVADFGGGTSDFCLVRLGPSRAKMNDPAAAILGTQGVGLAGDAFDRRIVENGVAEFLGKDVTFHSHGKDLPVPAWLYGKLGRWHHVSFLNTPSTLRMLKDIQRHASDPDQIEDLLTLIEYNLGYHLYRAVQAVKLDLSNADETELVFHHDPLEIRRKVTRSEFEGWIAPELAEIEGCVEALLAQTGLAADKVDRVFMTGGTSLVPAVRKLFADRFGAGKISSGGEFVSVANGLAYRARELWG
jgi:hypothetical chaperone protein